jgi:hypothetical protein
LNFVPIILPRRWKWQRNSTFQFFNRRAIAAISITGLLCMLPEEQGGPLFAMKFCGNGDVKLLLLELMTWKSNSLLFEVFADKSKSCCDLVKIPDLQKYR